MKITIYSLLLLILFSSCSSSYKTFVPKREREMNQLTSNIFNKITKIEAKPIIPIEVLNKNIKPEIPIEILNKKGIVTHSRNYKSQYPRLLPYLLYNENNVFNNFAGDFVNVKNDELSNLNLMVEYDREFGNYKNSLIVLIAKSDNSIGSLQKIPISVKSSKYGNFSKAYLKDDKINKSQQRILFVRKIKINNDFDILDKVYDDVITVTIGEQNYNFLNPEFEIK